MGQYAVRKSPESAKGRDNTRKLFLIGATAPVGKDGLVRFAYTDLKNDSLVVDTVGKTAGKDDAKQLALGYVHNLSKRTAVYATYAQIENSRDSNFRTTSESSLGAVTGKNYSSFEFGIRHSF
jgi:predicted porin